LAKTAAPLKAVRRWRIRRAITHRIKSVEVQRCLCDLVVATDRSTQSLSLRTDGQGHRRHNDGRICGDLDGCLDVDIWPTPFTNSFPIRRQPMAVGERREFRMAWIFGPDLRVQPQPQAYTRLGERLYLLQNLDGSGFSVELPVDEDGLVMDYPGLFRRVTTNRSETRPA
jgi:hypothetical protein